jgi:peptidoglycan/xylan/chitin deacetylase (PgdA/CDA1 family)
MVIGKNKILFTFDDGPDPKWTMPILDALKESNQTAIFFILGKQIKNNEKIIERIIDEDHVIGNHGMNHFPLIYNSDILFTKEILSVHKYIKDEFDYDIHYFRPPWGVINKKLKKRCVHELGYEIMLWDRDSRDYLWPFKKRIRLKKSGSTIILMHDGHAYTPLKNREHTLKTIQLLLDDSILLK